MATLGTSLTNEHSALLRRFSPDGCVLLFDGDKAGRTAAERAFRALASEVLPARIALLGEGDDPADLARRGGIDALEVVLEGAEDALRVYVRLLGERHDLRTHDGRARAVLDCAEVLSGIPDRFRREDLLQRFSGALMLPPDQLAEQVKVRARPGGGGASSGGQTADAAMVRIEPAVAHGVPGPSASEAAELDHGVVAAHEPAAVTKAKQDILAALLAEPELVGEILEVAQAERLLGGVGPAWRLVSDAVERVCETGSYPDQSVLLDRWLTLAAGDSATQRFVHGLRGAQPADRGAR